MFVGLAVSYYADTSGSATMAVIPIVLFFAVLTFRSLRRAPNTPAVDRG